MSYIPLRVVTITNNLEAYPEFTKDTLEFTFLVGHIEDEVETFIVGEDDYWRQQDFFPANGGIKHLVVTVGELG